MLVFFALKPILNVQNANQVDYRSACRPPSTDTLQNKLGLTVEEALA